MRLGSYAAEGEPPGRQAADAGASRALPLARDTPASPGTRVFTLRPPNKLEDSGPRFSLLSNTQGGNNDTPISGYLFFLGGGGGRCVPLTCSHSKAVQNMGSGHRQGPDIGDSSWNLPQDADPPPPTPWPFLRERLCSPCREAQVRSEPLRGLPGGPHPELHPPSSRFCVSYQLSNNGEPLLPHVSSAGMRRWGDGCLRGGGRRRAAAAKGSSEGRRF